MKPNDIYFTVALFICTASTAVVTAQTTTKRADTLVLKTANATKKLVVGGASATVVLPSQSGTLARQGAISSLPLGTITTISHKATIPEGFVACNGQAISRSEYAELYAAIGTTYGAGNGTTTFNVPKLLDPYIPRDFLLGWWPFNGNANDEWVYGHDGTVNGPILTTDRFGNQDAAFYFDGVDDYVKISSSFFDNGWNYWTFSTWVRLATNPNPIKVFFNTSPHNGVEIGAGPGPRYTVGVGNAAGVWAYLDPVPYMSNTPWVTDAWKHIAVVRSGLSVRMYIDGVEDIEFTLNGLPPTALCQMFIGRCDCGANQGEHMEGKLDDIGIWNRALTDDEVKQLYDAASRYIIRAE